MTILQTHKETSYIFITSKDQAQDCDIYMTMSKPSDKSTAPREPLRDERIIIKIIIILLSRCRLSKQVAESLYCSSWNFFASSLAIKGRERKGITPQHIHKAD